MSGDGRVPCPHCGARILSGARKCRGCRRWLGVRGGARVPRIAVVVASVTCTVMALLVTSRESLVGEAPPLTSLGPRAPEPAPGASPASYPAAEAEPPGLAPPATPRGFRSRDIAIGDVHPLGIVFSPSGTSVYVSADDATLREYRLDTGELVHKASVMAQGDRIKLLFDRYVAVLRREEASRIPVMDTTAWDRDPVLLDLGRSPRDIIELGDGRSVVAASGESRRVARFDLPTGARLANITLPHAIEQLFLVRAEGQSYLGAVGSVSHADRPTGAWLELFDPAEDPFGATRRSIAVGRSPRPAAVSRDGKMLLLPDQAANSVTLVRLGGETHSTRTNVGQSPEAAFMMNDDRHGITLNGRARTASVIDLATMQVVSTLMLSGNPRSGAISPDGRTLFVSLGGSSRPPKESGVAVITGDPPKVVASLSTGLGAGAVAVSKDGKRAAIACWLDRSVTVVEP